jgi:hypothetical protein
LPKTLRDLRIEGEWSKTKSPIPERFLLHDNFSLDKRIIIFATDNGLLRLSNARTLMMDGNFGISPKNFLQLYVIRVPFGPVTVSTVYALMQNKTGAAYKELFDTIFEKF